jgi:hypothetical protein
MNNDRPANTVADLLEGIPIRLERLEHAAGEQ